MRPSISIIIPCYNVWKYLPQCMASLERQTIGIERLQLIFVDDASTDEGKTWECILAFEKKYPDSVIAIRLEENRCQGGARNEGLRYADGDYIGFVDADDWIEPTMYEQLYRCAKEYGCDAADCRLAVNLEDGTLCVQECADDRMDAFEKSTLEGDDHWIDAFTGGPYGGGVVTGLYRRELILGNRLYFPEHVKYEDNYWQSILLLYVRKFYHLAEDLYHYRENGESTIHVRNSRHHFDRLDIEERKLSAYKELGVYDRFKEQIERDFLRMYYCNTMTLLWSRFDVPPYDIFLKMEQTVMRLFPNYSENPYFAADSVDKMLVGLIGRNLSEVQFIEAGKVFMSCLDELENIQEIGEEENDSVL